MSALSPEHMQRIRATLARGSFGGMIVAVLLVLTAFLTEVFLARLLGTEEYGRYVFSISIVTLLALASRTGLDNAIVRFVPSYAATRQWGLLRGLARYSSVSALSIGILLAAIFAVVVATGAVIQDGNMNSVLLASACLVPVLSLGTIYQSHLRAYKRVVIAQMPLNILAPAALIAAATAVAWSGLVELRAHGVVAIQLTVSMAATAVLWTAHRRIRPAAIVSVSPEYRIREWIRVAMVMFFVTGMQMVVNQSDTIMLGLLADTTRAGQYNAAAKVAMLTSAPIFIVNMIAVPMISEFHASNRPDALSHMLRLVVRSTVLLTLVAALVIVGLGKFVLQIFGPDFIVAYPVLLLLVIGHMINALSGASGPLLMQTGHHAAAAIIMATWAAINLALNYVLIPLYGMEGAAIASAVTLAGWNIAMVVYARRKLQMDPSILGGLARSRP